MADGDDAELHVERPGPGHRPGPARRRCSSRSRPAIRTTGTGLGLAIVSEIVAAHGGAFTLEPRLGGGTVARIHLPGAAVRPAVLA